MTLNNPLTCKGFSEDIGGWVANGDCMGARLGFVILFFVIAILRKWVFEMIQIPYNFIVGIIGAELTYLIIVILFGAMKWAMLFGIIVGIVGGIAGAMVFGESEDSGY